MKGGELVRTAIWAMPLAAAYALVALRGPARRSLTGILLAIAWNLWALLAMNVIAAEVGWWDFSPELPGFMGVPIELWFGWTLLWGAVVPLVASRQPLIVTLVALLWLDLITMPLLEPLVVLQASWIVGEFLILLVALLPGLLLFRWTVTGTNLEGRAALQVVCAGGLLVWLVPSAAMASSGGWSEVLRLPGWRLSLFVQLAAAAAAIGVRAVIEFVQRGRGTPLPYDPPACLVRSGPYSYVRNPMQLSMVLLFAVAAMFLWNMWLIAAAAVALLYGAGLASWHENVELTERFGIAWTLYRQRVRAWVPMLRPIVSDEATLLVAYSCTTCSSIGRWFNAREPIGLTVTPAEDAAVGLRRVTYLPAGGPPSQGVAAIARALEHIHLGWAVVGWLLAVPGVGHLAQLLADVFGPTTHPVSGMPYDPAACDAAGTGVVR